METVVHNIRDLSGDARSAAERLVGHKLREDQQLVIQVVGSGTAVPEPNRQPAPIEGVPQAWNIYEGLSDERIDELDQAIRQRANLARDFD